MRQKSSPTKKGTVILGRVPRGIKTCQNPRCSVPRHDIAVFVRRLTGLLRPGVYNLQVQAPDEVARHGITQDVEFMVR